MTKTTKYDINLEAKNRPRFRTRQPNTLQVLIISI